MVPSGLGAADAPGAAYARGEHQALQSNPAHGMIVSWHIFLFSSKEPPATLR